MFFKPKRPLLPETPAMLLEGSLEDKCLYRIFDFTRNLQTRLSNEELVYFSMLMANWCSIRLATIEKVAKKLDKKGKK